jgi:hypothetical protein
MYAPLDIMLFKKPSIFSLIFLFYLKILALVCVLGRGREWLKHLFFSVISPLELFLQTLMYISNVQNLVLQLKKMTYVAHCY